MDKKEREKIEERIRELESGKPEPLSKEWWEELRYLDKVSEVSELLDELEKCGTLYIKTDDNGKIMDVYELGKPTIDGLNIMVPHAISMNLSGLNISDPCNQELFLSHPVVI